MSKDTLSDIVRLCLALDQLSFGIYKKFSSWAETENLKRFWIEMSEDEQRHVEFWKKMANMAENGMLPQVFDDPENIKAELEQIRRKVHLLWDHYEDSPSMSSTFLLAYRMEFYLLHPAIGMLFHYMKGVGDESNIEDTYDSHLNRFIDMLSTYGDVTPELDLLGDTLQSLWKKNRQLARQSFVDPLTDIFNRRGFFNTIKPLAHLSIRNKANVGILMMDIDNFKIINDTHGHRKGDDVLKTVATILKSNVRASDIVGRYGGEEFIAFFHAVGKDSLYRIAEEIRQKIEDGTKDDVPVTVSIGIVHGALQLNAEGETLSLINRADESLYRAKESGKNVVIMN